MTQSSTSTFQRFKQATFQVLRFIWLSVIFLLGAISIVVIPFSIFEYSPSPSEIDFSELFFVILFSHATFHFFQTSHQLKFSPFESTKSYFIPLGYLITLIIIVGFVLDKLQLENIIIEPIFDLISYALFVLTIFVTQHRLKTEQRENSKISEGEIA